MTRIAAAGSPLLAMAVILVLASCSALGIKGSGEAVDQTLSLGVGQDAELSNGAEFGFSNVVNDSRCPKDATCVWAGTATARFWIREARADSLFVLAVLNGGTSRTDTGAHLPTEIGDYRVTLLELEPYPVAGQRTPGSRYRAMARVERQAAR
jgi:hypothetical protein